MKVWDINDLFDMGARLITHNTTYIWPSEETQACERIEDVRDEFLAPLLPQDIMSQGPMMRFGKQKECQE